MSNKILELWSYWKAERQLNKNIRVCGEKELDSILSREKVVPLIIGYTDSLFDSSKFEDDPILVSKDNWRNDIEKLSKDEVYFLVGEVWDVGEYLYFLRKLGFKVIIGKNPSCYKSANLSEKEDYL